MHPGTPRLIKNLLLSSICALVLLYVIRASILWPGPIEHLQPEWAPFDEKITSESVSEDHSEQDSSNQDDSDPVTLVVASQTSDNTTWLQEVSPSWRKAIYLTDAPSDLSVPANKGREGMVYLTYIIDNYDHLPPVMIFQHANRYQWHNDDPLYDGQRMLSRLQVPFVIAQGYVNLRCVWTLGCPAEIRPIEEYNASPPANDTDVSSGVKAGSFYKAAFETLFPDVTVPEAIGASCCAQFAVTAGKVRERPKSDYESYRRWLLETKLPDDISGRVMEYSWHMIFGKDAVHCPNAQQCYCDVYGICNLNCEKEGVCRDQYTLPKYSVMPEGWPEYDWDGNWQNVTQLRLDQEID